MSRLRSNKVVNQAGTGAPELTYGAVVPGTGTISGAGKVSIGGSITAGSFHGDGSGLSGVGDPSALKDGNNVKVQATSTGADVTGNLLPEADNTRDLGSTSKRWANLYVGDMHYSNEGSSNNVDGTWGSYTIQEGQNDLFLINNRNGKKYKFNLTEVV